MSIAAIIVLALVAAFVVHVMRRPDTFSVERSVEIAAPPARILAQIADFHAWRDFEAGLAALKTRAERSA